METSLFLDPLHQDIDSSNPGIMKIEAVTGDSRPLANGAPDTAVRKRKATGSALVDSTDPGRRGIDPVLDLARDGAHDADAAGPT